MNARYPLQSHQSYDGSEKAWSVRNSICRSLSSEMDIVVVVERRKVAHNSRYLVGRNSLCHAFEGHYSEYDTLKFLRRGPENTQIEAREKATLYYFVIFVSLPSRHVAIPGEKAGSQLLRQRESAARSHEAVGPNRSSQVEEY